MHQVHEWLAIGDYQEPRQIVQSESHRFAAQNRHFWWKQIRVLRVFPTFLDLMLGWKRQKCRFRVWRRRVFDRVDGRRGPPQRSSNEQECLEVEASDNFVTWLRLNVEPTDNRINPCL